MRLFRATYKDRHGRTRESQNWYAEVRMDRQQRRLPLFTDKTASAECARKIERLIALKAAGETPDVVMQGWLSHLPGEITRKLHEWGLLSAERMSSVTPLAVVEIDPETKDKAVSTGHVADFLASLKHKAAKGNIDLHRVKVVQARILIVIESCGFKAWTDVDAETIDNTLTDMVTAGDIAADTANGYIQAFKQFCSWMVREGRVGISPVARLQKFPIDENNTTRRRRALSTEEQRWLISSTGEEPERYGMSGHERRLIYWLTLETGLRAGEPGKLTRASFALDDPDPKLIIRGADTKNKKPTQLPLRPDLAEALQDHLKGRLPAAPAFPAMPPSYDTAAMLREDLAAARIRWLKIYEDFPAEERQKILESDFLRLFFYTTISLIVRHKQVT